MTIGNARYLTDLDIRMWLRDQKPELNKLIGDYEFSSEELRSAQTFAVDFYNERPPLIGNYDYTAFPWRYHLLMGTVANLLFIAANLYRRNNLNYNVAGGAINDQDKAPAYEAEGNRLWQEYKQWVDHIKRSQNIDQGFGVVG